MSSQPSTASQDIKNAQKETNLSYRSNSISEEELALDRLHSNALKSIAMELIASCGKCGKPKNR